MEVITMESDAYKRLVNKIEQIADFVAKAKLPSEEKRCMYKLSEVERCLEERTIRCKPGNLEEFRRNYLNRTGHDKKR